ncbi:ribosome maturation factor RimM [Pontibacter sp. G13]|uniref:ribosome maturation factor RimM n=1 Tax=Pontibacter sp. G13 TaxID=3074898 RepID=UPI00288A6240|nr:ribosome maturation factor RimM [Pontibacter sp. G13]WNJ17935.1 ribosome maturation factor RimM [Pontibacter sp. G13]
MHRSECIELGYVTKPHGLQGELKSVWDVHDIHEYSRSRILYLAKKDGPINPFRVESFHVINNKSALLSLKGVESRMDAEELGGSTIYFPLELLPKLKDGHFYYFQIMGFEVVDEKLGTLGNIVQVVDQAAQDLLVMEYQGHEVLIPMTDQFVKNADLEAKQVFTNLPEGLMDLYLNPESLDED